MLTRNNNIDYVIKKLCGKASNNLEGQPIDKLFLNKNDEQNICRFLKLVIKKYPLKIFNSGKELYKNFKKYNYKKACTLVMNLYNMVKSYKLLMEYIHKIYYSKNNLKKNIKKITKMSQFCKHFLGIEKDVIFSLLGKNRETDEMGNFEKNVLNSFGQGLEKNFLLAQNSEIHSIELEKRINQLLKYFGLSLLEFCNIQKISYHDFNNLKYNQKFSYFMNMLSKIDIKHEKLFSICKKYNLHKIKLKKLMNELL